MRIKKRYLFPSLYLFFISLALLGKLGGLLMLLIAPMALVMIGVEVLVGEQFGDQFFLIVLGNTAAYLLIGVVWDRISKNANDYSMRD